MVVGFPEKGQQTDTFVFRMPSTIGHRDGDTFGWWTELVQGKYSVWSINTDFVYSSIANCGKDREYDYSFKISCVIFEYDLEIYPKGGSDLSNSGPELDLQKRLYLYVEGRRMGWPRRLVSEGLNSKP